MTRTQHGPVDGVVMSWRVHEGWGSVASGEVVGEAWVHFSVVEGTGYRELRQGQRVRFSYETPGQDGYPHRATSVNATAARRYLAHVSGERITTAAEPAEVARPGTLYYPNVPRVERAQFILYVADQERSTRFYTAALDAEPQLDVPGMTEFALGASAVLGLMPTEAIKRLLPSLADPGSTAVAPSRAELYLLVADPVTAHQRALDAGARELSPVRERDWGHLAGYSLDPDGHVVAFAR